ncbi:MAG: acyl-CoA thioesterase [Oligoflexales bacterium]
METKGKKPSESFVEMTELVLPQHTNALGTIFGGVVMSWIDIAAATCAIRHANRQVVTASVDALNFLAPIKLGWIVTLRASVNYVAKTSCEVGVKVTTENPITGHKYDTANAYLTMVAIDATGNPVPMTPLTPETEQEKKRFVEAENRRKQRLATK